MMKNVRFKTQKTRNGGNMKIGRMLKNLKCSNEKVIYNSRDNIYNHRNIQKKT